MKRALLPLFAITLVAACSDKDGAGNSEEGINIGDGDGDGDGDGVGGTRLDIGGGNTDTEQGGDNTGDCSEGDLPATNAVLEGTVYAPNLELPISGALVYLTTEEVEPVPDGVYCAECVELDCEQHHVLTEPDGSFSLPAIAGSGQTLVVQKGQFLHTVDFDVAEGTNVVPANQSNLPGLWNPDAGMWIPRISVYETSPDKVYNVLAKFGLGQTDAGGNLVAGTEQFTLVSDGDEGAFMDNLPSLNQNHIIFVPCAATKYWLGAPTVSAQRAQNVREFVEAGGKWYVTDHSNEYIQQPFSLYQDFHNPGMPDLQPAYDVSGTVLDEGLLAWLQALPDPLKDIGGGSPNLYGLPAITLELNYSGIDAVHDVIVENDEGEEVNVGHHTWVEGPCTSCSDAATIRPMAISGSYGCGRMMYSTFENSSIAHQGMTPQELVLLYMILEIGVCHGDPPPPPPPIG